jgi:nucleoside-diphosphate-sugar epimerase
LKIFVAGATGVLGTAAVARLLATGYEVTGVARTEDKARRLGAFGATPAVVDIFDHDALVSAMSGHDVVCNLATHIPSVGSAARTSAWRENDLIRTEGTRTLTQAAMAAGVQRFVQEAIAFVYADGGAAPITETHPTAPLPPTRSSLAATDAVQRFATEGRFGVVLRFGTFYGDDALTRWQLDATRRGRAFLCGAPEGYVSPLHIDDAASAVAYALGSPSGIYNVAAEPVTRDEWAAALGRAAGGAPARYVAPLLQRLGGWRAEVTGRSLRLSSEAYRAATGWRARVRVNEGWPEQP